MQLQVTSEISRASKSCTSWIGISLYFAYLYMTIKSHSCSFITAKGTDRCHTITAWQKKKLNESWDAGNQGRWVIHHPMVSSLQCWFSRLGILSVLDLQSFQRCPKARRFHKISCCKALKPIILCTANTQKKLESGIGMWENVDASN